MRLVLFDIDGTLIDSGRVGSKAINTAFLMRYGIENATKNFFFDGKTDRQIVRELLEQHKLLSINESTVQAEMQKIFDDYLELLTFESAQATSGHIHPGMIEILTEIDAQNNPNNGLVVALLTGNIEKGARIKLERFGLNPFFPFGAFGSDAEHREDLVPIAVHRAKAFCGQTFSSNEVFIVGDSIRDIRCAKANHAVSIAVATGSTPRSELEKETPDFLFDDLKNPRPFLNIVTTGKTL